MKEKEKTRPINQEILRSEVNLMVYPFFSLSRHGLKEINKVEYRSEVVRNDEKLEVLWKVSANTEYGFPRSFDKKVYRAIEEIICSKSLPVENPVEFSIYQICKKTGISTGGTNYRKIKTALKRIQSTAITSKGTFFHKGQKRWLEKSFHIYSDIIFSGQTKPDGAIAETNSLYLGNVYLQSINARYVRPIDYEYYKQLEGNISSRLYELLGVKFYGIVKLGQRQLRYRYSTLCQLLPVKRQRYFSKAKQILNRAHKELKETNYLEDYRWEEIEEDDDWLIYYRPGARARQEIEDAKDVSQVSPRASEDVARLQVTEDEMMSVNVWISELTEKLNDDQKENEKFYEKLAKLVVKDKVSGDIVRKCLAEAKSEDQMRQRDPEATPIENRSAYFTNLLKRRLKEKDKDLNELLEGD